MNKVINEAIGCAFALTASNFLYQAFTEKNYALAFDRSFFQCVALIAFLLPIWKNHDRQ